MSRAPTLFGMMAPQGVVRGALAQQFRPPSLLDEARREYPYLRDKDIAFAYTPDAPSHGGALEFWHADDPGAPDVPRPADLPIGRIGLQVFKPDVRTSDILADYVSHWAVDNDPKLKQIYQEFAASMDPDVMRGRYEYDRKHFGERRSYQQWLQMSGMPGVFRGYTFRQWPDEWNKRFYKPEQIEILNRARKHVGYR